MALRRRASMTMPGSLFPRSTSIQPESPPRYPDDEPRQVRWAPDVFSPPLRHEAESSANPIPSASFRPRTAPSVKAAVLAARLWIHMIIPLVCPHGKRAKGGLMILRRQTHRVKCG
ncbi:hypothetical protein K438DRAFT_428702 [Mycena galopus ATCC 62051]|nr:hypothetical protein K438DRAFT_428702 [Mycena galopus ATCC 62051]